MSRLSHERRLLALALAGAAPGFLLAALLLGSFRAAWPWLAGAAGAAALSLLAFRRLRREVARPLQTLTNLLAALREGDFSFRARTGRERGDLESVFLELNALSDLLQQHRLKALEATALLRTVMAEIDVAIFAFDEDGLLRLVNRAGEALLGQPKERLLGRALAELGLAQAAEEEGPRLLDLALPGRTGRFERRRTVFRQSGRPHLLLVLSDLTRPLREEEREAWQRLIRVLGHEINNSIAPIQSLSGSIATLIERQPDHWREDAAEGLGIIASRTQSLGRFLTAYAALARLPDLRLGPVGAGPLMRRLAALEPRLAIQVDEGPEVEFLADEVQVEQALINLVRNAADAALEQGGGVRLSWRLEGRWIEFDVEDEGAGLPGSGNLFVPFFTTKPGGNGIGLVLARQVAEGHRGSLQLANREPKGARARFRLPLDPRQGLGREDSSEGG